MMIEWLRDLLQKLDIEGTVSIGPTTMHCDNQAAMEMAETTQFPKKTKHIAIRYHYVRDLVDNETIEMAYVSTGEIIADGLTKPVGKEKHKGFVQALNLGD